MRIGIDFDNTVVAYDEVFLSTARDRGLVPQGFIGSKQEIRDAIRLLPGGEISWQRLQSYVYGVGITEARLFQGVDRFLHRCWTKAVPIVIVSHKTEFGHHSAEINLRAAALEWLNVNGFFNQTYGITAGEVYFESTRADKLARIASLGCTHFIDDLEEVLIDPAFPPRVTRILFSDTEIALRPAPYIVCPTWRDIEEQIFREHN